MSKYRAEIALPAEKDLLAIGVYIANELLEPDKAVEVIDKIASAILKLEEIHYRHGLVNDEKLASQGIRKFIVDNYLIFYTVNKENKVVIIIRVLYQRRDWLNIL